MKTFEIVTTEGEGLGNSLNEIINKKVSFKIHKNGNGVHCYVRAIGQGSDSDLIIEIPFSSTEKSRNGYLHFLKQECDLDEKKLLGYEYQKMGLGAVKIISDSEIIPIIDGFVKYSESRPFKSSICYIYYNQGDVDSKIEEATNYAQLSMSRINREKHIGSLPE